MSFCMTGSWEEGTWQLLGQFHIGNAQELPTGRLSKQEKHMFTNSATWKKFHKLVLH